MNRQTLPPIEPREAGTSLQYVVGGIYRLLQEHFGERDTAIFWRYDAGEKAVEIAKVYDLSRERVKQIVKSVERYVNDCFFSRSLRLMPLIQQMKSEPERLDAILAGAGYEIDKFQVMALRERPVLEPLPQLVKTELDSLKLNARSINALIHHRITTIEALCNLTRHDLHVLRGLGEDSIKHIERALNERGLHIKK